ncbi:tRNA dihydrouridine(20/20a) synthase DusA [Nodosilinea sp. PGN35]|uniref:tRNA dihydrouridine(20/20a) synthase DusA n=1 Tax=Nodosilinea sp. PGN35 TaxID=3020489 RepID=UPI0023B21D06|nr:tRNA dihydrouridine(20/20a) synthase DusA [Nodosilinea sp. TSF1-S3]MDF0369357.1 tRNA dihydrouridine(20/20a) synthase DusA [Nodosilinea sp. TSF1-S3]
MTVSIRQASNRAAVATSIEVPLSIAPMMDRTDRHYRYFMRQITRHTLLYTEMVTAQAILYGDRDHLLGFTPSESPLVLQVGGDDPQTLAAAARAAADFGYSAINLNVGCPSDRVRSGNFGACLMTQPQRVAEGVAAMLAASPLPVSVKHRIGVDDCDRYEDMAAFVATVAQTGCRHFTVHARKAWLQGLSPKDNRTVPPLRYGDVHRLKREFPHLWVEINGGFTGLKQVTEQLAQVDGVMIGRAAYDHPYLFSQVDQRLFAAPAAALSRQQVVEAMLPYIDHWTRRGLKLNKITRHMLMLFAGQPGSRHWKQRLTESSCRPGAGAEVVAQALAAVQRQSEIQAALRSLA